MLVVPDAIQSNDLIIGQDVLDQVIAIQHKGKWWFTRLKMDDITEIYYVSTKIALKMVTEEIIPPLSVKFCEVKAEEVKTVYVDECL